MSIRFTDSSLASVLSDRISKNRQRVDTLQEQISSGKRINRPSDDPFGAEAVLRIRTSEANVQQFQENAATVKDGLSMSDGALESYQQLMDRAQALLTQGASDSTSTTAKQALATELDSIRTQMLALANKNVQGVYLFGGTRQTAPPFSSAGTPPPTAIAPQMVQIEPGAAPIAAGVTADTIFANSTTTVFATLNAAAAALRGTGNPVADQATVLSSLDTLTTFATQATTARTQVGASLAAVDDANNRMSGELLSFQTAADQLETADMAQTSVALVQAQNGLQATLQATTYTNKGSLMDLIG